jgi:CheY-like chemotaxis protein
VEHATSAKSGVERLRAFAPDLVFLDNRIPPYTDFRPGLKALRDAGYEGPVVVQSACVADEIFDEAPRLGVAEVIDKFDMNDVRLIELLQKHTGFRGGGVEALRVHPLGRGERSSAAEACAEDE